MLISEYQSNIYGNDFLFCKIDHAKICIHLVGNATVTSILRHFHRISFESFFESYWVAFNFKFDDFIVKVLILIQFWLESDWILIFGRNIICDHHRETKRENVIINILRAASVQQKILRLVSIEVENLLRQYLKRGSLPIKPHL